MPGYNSQRAKQTVVELTPRAGTSRATVARMKRRRGAASSLSAIDRQALERGYDLLMAEELEAQRGSAA